MVSFMVTGPCQHCFGGANGKEGARYSAARIRHFTVSLYRRFRFSIPD